MGNRGRKDAITGLDIKCDVCKHQITVTAALLFSPPSRNNVKKFHICQTCYNTVISFLKL